jgi:hypothetical protein
MKYRSTLKFRVSLLVLFLCFFSSYNILAQENGIYELDNQITNNQKNDKTKKDNRANFYDLALNMHPTHYRKDKKLKEVYGNGFAKKITFEDLISAKFINEDLSTDYSNVELITIKLLNVSDLNNTIDLTNQNQKLKKLKYVFIKCNFDCNNEQIKKFIKVNPNIRVFYKTDKAS